MAILQTVEVKTTALWPQGDIRDPLGVWGFRRAVTGDGTGGGVKVNVIVPADQNAAYIYTCYHAIVVPVSQATPNDQRGKVRLLTNWPNVDPQAGVQAYATAKEVTIVTSSNFTSPIGAPNQPFIDSLDRFILLFDPRPAAGELTIMELEINVNITDDVYSMEGYGYFWDRSVLNAPGGPRHPGSS